jgi:hypothetical protein
VSSIESRNPEEMRDEAEAKTEEDVERESMVEEKAETEMKTEESTEAKEIVEEQQQDEETENLVKRLKGDWKVSVTRSKPDGSVSNGKGKIRTSDLISRKGIRGTLELNVDGGERYSEDNLWAVDPSTRKVHNYSIKSDGSVHDHVGEWKDDSSLDLHWEGTYQDRPVMEDYEYRWVSPKEIRVHKVDRSEGEEVFVSDYVLRR